MATPVSGRFTSHSLGCSPFCLDFDTAYVSIYSCQFFVYPTTYTHPNATFWTICSQSILASTTTSSSHASVPSCWALSARGVHPARSQLRVGRPFRGCCHASNTAHHHRTRGLAHSSQGLLSRTRLALAKCLRGSLSLWKYRRRCRVPACDP